MKWICALCLMACSPLNYASERGSCDAPYDILVQTLKSRIVQDDVWMTHFTQANHIKALSLPLNSEGYLYVKRGNGLVWQVTAPVASTVVLNRAGVDTGEGLIAASRITATLLQNVLLGNFSELDAHFSLRGCYDDHSWQIRLEPRQGYLRDRLLRIELTGQQQVLKMWVFQPGENYLEVQFAPTKSLGNLPADIAVAIEAG